MRIRILEYVTTVRVKGLSEKLLNSVFSVLSQLIEELGVSNLSNDSITLMKLTWHLIPKCVNASTIVEAIMLNIWCFPKGKLCVLYLSKSFCGVLSPVRCVHMNGQSTDQFIDDWRPKK